MEWSESGGKLVGVKGWYIGEIVHLFNRWEWTLKVSGNSPFMAGMAFSEREAKERVRKVFLEDVMACLG